LPLGRNAVTAVASDDIFSLIENSPICTKKGC